MFNYGIGGRYRNYEACSKFEQDKVRQGYKRLKEYKDYYLYGKYDNDGNLLYKECFSKFDIDGIKGNPSPATYIRD